MDLSSIFYVFARAAGGRNSNGIREMWPKSALRRGFLYMGSGRLISLTRIFSTAQIEEEYFARCKRNTNTQAAREGRTHEPETPPEVPGDGPVVRNSAFRKISPRWRLSFEMTLNLSPDNSRMIPDQPWDILKIFGFDYEPDTKCTRNT